MGENSEVNVHDILLLLSSFERDYLVRNNGDQVAIATLQGKELGLYFYASLCPPWERFTTHLVDVYDKLVAEGDFEVVLISVDDEVEPFNRYFSTMPWLAIPFTDTKTQDALNLHFNPCGLPHLIFLNKNGKVVKDGRAMLIREYGAKAFPFTQERFTKIKEEEEEARNNQSLRSILESPSYNLLITADGNMTLVSDLEGGKTVGLYFFLSTLKKYTYFTPLLLKVYNKWKAAENNFEVIMISLDDDEELFNKELNYVPLFAIPFQDKRCNHLIKYFKISRIPTFVIIGPDGKTLNPNAVDIIEENGKYTYPFTVDSLSKHHNIEKVRQEAQTLESLLVSEDLDFVVGKDGVKVRYHILFVKPLCKLCISYVYGSKQ